MDARQDEISNPFGMDEHCRNCSALCESRSELVHGYGDVAADFLFVAERPTPGADETGIPFHGDELGERFQSVLEELYLASKPADEPELDGAFLTHLTRCRHPERPPTDEEIGNCDPFLNAELRMINPEIIVPIGQRALTELAREHTTTPVEAFDVREDHATRIRGRGFELVPMLHPADWQDGDRAEFVDAFRELLASDYRQTKGRRSR